VLCTSGKHATLPKYRVTIH